MGNVEEFLVKLQIEESFEPGLLWGFLLEDLLLGGDFTLLYRNRSTLW